LLVGSWDPNCVPEYDILQLLEWMVEPNAPVVAEGGGLGKCHCFGLTGVVADLVGFTGDVFASYLQSVITGPFESLE